MERMRGKGCLKFYGAAYYNEGRELIGINSVMVVRMREREVDITG